MTRDSPRTTEYRETTRGFAASLTDAFTGDRPSGVEVTLDPVDDDPIVNPSGFHVFLAFEPDEVLLTVDGGDRYVDERRRVLLGEAAREADEADGADGPPVAVVDDPTEPVEVELTPTPAYEFPPTTTVLRGHVRDGDGDPVVGAEVRLREFDPVVETTEAGEYALFVPATSEDVTRRDGQNVVAVDDGNGSRPVADGGTGVDPTLAVRHPDYGERAHRVEVAAGTSTVHHVTL